jgi:uncharacterized surface protein with fasciclin (FAS1) repeats
LEAAFHSQAVTPQPLPFFLPAAKNEIMKEENVFDVIKDDQRFSILTQILDRTGIGTALASEREPFTFFAPTDAALERLPTAALRLLTSSEGRDFALGLLSEHLIPQSYLYADDLRHTAALKTLNGRKARISVEKNVLSFGRAHVLTPGIAARNGVIFPVDRVLSARRRRHASHA